ncbi:MAG: outer membrane lipoprotein-sorting protein [Acidiferrobacterales bacterium]
MSSALLLALWFAVTPGGDGSQSTGITNAQLPAAQAAAPAGASPVTLLNLADAPRKALVNSMVDVHAVVSQARKPDQAFDMKVYLGSGERELVSFIGGKDQGRKFLMAGNKAWLLVPGSKHPIAISANQRMVGSFSFSDLARIRLSADFDGVLRQQPEACDTGGTPVQETCRVLDITAKSRSAPYASGTLWINAEGTLLRAVYALPSGKAAKQVVYRYAHTNGSPVLSEMKIEDLLMPAQHIVTRLKFGKRHEMRFSSKEFDPEYALTH